MQAGATELATASAAMLTGAVSATILTVAVSEPLTVTTKVLVLVDLGFTEETTEGTEATEATGATAATETGGGMNAGLGAAVSMIGAIVTVLLT